MIKHFFKILTIFLFMIILGLVGIFLVNSFDKEGINQTIDVNNTVAK